MAKKVLYISIRHYVGVFGVLLSLACADRVCFANEGPPPGQYAEAGPSAAILAPAELPEKDRAQLERSYLFEYKQKDRLVSPFSPGAEMPMDPEELEAINEREKLYRYFGVAVELHKEGKYEEAIEILKYILIKTPDDKYVRNYLRELRSDYRTNKARWKKTVAAKSGELKKTQKQTLLQDGIIAYKRKDLDTALLHFVDLLALDPGNRTARSYIDRLKKHYLKQVRVDNIMNAWAYSKDERTPSLADLPESSGLEAGGKTEEAAKEELMSIRSSEHRDVFNYYYEKAREYALKGRLNQAHKACRMIFTVIPDMSKETRAYLVAEIESLQKHDSGTTKKPATTADRRAVKSAKSLLDKVEATRSNVNKKAASLLDEQEFQELVVKKRADGLLEKTELSFTIEDIVDRKKEETEKARYFSLGPGDALQISVRDHPELSGKTTVQMNGQIILPLTYDTVDANGLTVGELLVEVTETMQRYVKDPVVNISVLEYRSKVFYIIDEQGATPYPITRANFTMRDALFISDWGTNRALGRVVVIKPHKVHPIVRKVNTFDLIYKGRLENNIPIESGDVIYVPMTIVRKTAEVLNNMFAPVRATRDGLNEVDGLYKDIRDIIQEYSGTKTTTTNN